MICVGFTSSSGPALYPNAVLTPVIEPQRADAAHAAVTTHFECPGGIVAHNAGADDAFAAKFDAEYAKRIPEELY